MTEGTPARGYSWPPFEPGNEVGVKFEPGNQLGAQFEPGNEVALKHGVYSPRKVDPRAREIVEVLLASGPAFLSDPAYSVMLHLLAKTLARLELFTEYLDQQGSEIDAVDEGKRHVASDKVDKLTRLAADLAGKLGLDPSTAAKIQRDLAQGKKAALGALFVAGQRLQDEARSRGSLGDKPKPQVDKPKEDGA